MGLTDLNFLLVSNRMIRAYNKKYLHHNYSTDVIAFETGDILVSSEMAKKQAREEGHSFLTEMKILMIHGMLHLVGYRDKNKKDKEKMWKKTYELLALTRRVK
ncbi:MAG: rRNA maturation RNase YbeY [Deltaproteobacteria bacterium]|nr:rRNA maturation RNase YbeY [Deltaproteobacteria bacterium]